MPLTSFLGLLLPRGLRPAGWVNRALGGGALLLGLVLVSFGGLLRWVSDFTANEVQLTALPVVRTLAELNSLPPGTELLLEGHAQRALLPPGQPHPAAQLGLLAWREEQLDRRKIGLVGRGEARWLPVDTVCPTLALSLREKRTPVLVSGTYRLLDPLLPPRADTAAGRLNPAVGTLGPGRFTGLRVGARVTVRARKTTAAVGESLPMYATGLRPGTAVDWCAADEKTQRFRAGFSWGLLLLGGGFGLTGGVVLAVERRCRNAARNAPAA